MIGDGPMYNQIKHLIIVNKISNVSLVKSVKYDEVGSYMRDSDIFLFPSIHEASSSIRASMWMWIACVGYGFDKT